MPADAAVRDVEAGRQWHPPVSLAVDDNDARPTVFRFDMMGKIVWKTYRNLTNIILRVSDGTAAGKENAVLVNSHIDRYPFSPSQVVAKLIGPSARFPVRVLQTTRCRLASCST